MKKMRTHNEKTMKTTMKNNEKNNEITMKNNETQWKTMNNGGKIGEKQ